MAEREVIKPSIAFKASDRIRRNENDVGDGTAGGDRGMTERGWSDRTA